MMRLRAGIGVAIVGLLICSWQDGRQSAIAQVEPAGRLLSLSAGHHVWGQPSPDGRLIAFRRPAVTEGPLPRPNELAVGDFAIGVIRDVVTHTPDDHVAPIGTPFAWSPDSTHLAYGWCTFVRPVEARPSTCEVRITNLATGGVRTIVPRRAGRAIPWVFTPDGREVLTIMAGPSGPISEIALVNVNDGSTRPLLRGVDASDFDDAAGAFSPDGQYFAFSRTLWQEHPYGAALPGNIEIVSIDGSVVQRTMDGPADEQVVAWTPDGQGLLYTSDRGGSTDLWRVAVRHGRIAGEPARLAGNVGGMSHAVITPLGDLVFKRHSPNSREVMVAPIERLSPLTVGRPVPASSGARQHREQAAWSPDGKYLAYRTGPTKPVALWSSEGMNTFTLQSMENGTVREVVARHRCAYTWSGTLLTWAPDGRSLLLSTGPRDCGGLFSIDAATGQVSTILQQRPSRVAWLPDGESIVYVPALGKDVRTRHVRTGEDRLVISLASVAEFENGSVRGFALSPDGRVAALMARRDVMLLTLADGSLRRSGPAPEGRWLEVAWLDRGQLLAVDGQGGRFWSVPLGGTPEPIKVDLRPGDQVMSLSVHPDRRSMAFGTFRVDTSAIVMLEKVVPPAGAGGRQ
jgi:Tol biopolymer transport system component